MIALVEAVGSGPIAAKDIAKRVREEIRNVIRTDGKASKLSDFEDSTDHPIAAAFHRACPGLDAPDSARLGYLLRKFQNRVVGGRSIERDKSNRDKVVLWRVKSSPAPTGASPAPTTRGMDETRGMENGIPRSIPAH
jgi:hypothetical protein